MSDLNGRQAAGDGQDGQVFDLSAAFESDADLDAVLVEIPVNKGPISSIVASPDGSRLMVTNYGHDSVSVIDVSVIDTDTCRVVETVAGINEPFAIAMGSEDVDRAYVTTVSAAYDSIGVIDTSTNTVVSTHPLALSVSDLVVSPDGKRVYASRNGVGGADVAVLDTTTGQVEVLDIATGPGTSTECVRVGSDGGRLYVGTNGPAGGQLVVIGADAQTGLYVIDTVPIGSPIRDVALSRNGATAYVASCGPDSGAVVDVVDTGANKILSTHKITDVSGIVTGLALSGDGDRAYLVTDDGVTVLCARTQDIIGAVGLSNQPSCVVESPNGKYLYVADYSGAVTVAPVASVVAPGIEPAAHWDDTAAEDDAAAEWAMPELPQLEPALA